MATQIALGCLKDLPAVKITARVSATCITTRVASHIRIWIPGHFFSFALRYAWMSATNVTNNTHSIGQTAADSAKPAAATTAASTAAATDRPLEIVWVKNIFVQHLCVPPTHSQQSML